MAYIEVYLHDMVTKIFMNQDLTKKFSLSPKENLFNVN